MAMLWTNDVISLAVGTRVSLADAYMARNPEVFLDQIGIWSRPTLNKW